MKSVIVVEDNFIVSQFMQTLCERAGYRVVGVAADAEAAEALLHVECPTHVLIDYRLAGERTGLDVANTAAEVCPSARRIFVTANTEDNTRAELERNEPWRILQKPVGAASLLEAMAD